MTHTNAIDKPGRTTLEVLLSILFPPAGAYAAVGLSKHFWINILLTILGWLPGVVHALWLTAENE